MKKRVVIPVQNPKAVLELAQSVKIKHLQDGDASILKVLNWQQLTLDIDNAQQSHDKAETLKREMLASYTERNLRLESVIEMLRNSRDLLTGANSKNMKLMGQWGFDVREPRSTPSTPDETALTK